ncbi:hypothetical protein CEK26_000054 [Fusarium fujikuroi]|nr:hypothetical protein CEK27_000053 [Fusarium fujikuroi]QGI75146.1 hypothetical protein CEK25_000052 [Fusarium fujikuroi]QGI88839.1 hypothetical protein CEK26_000054 [Fusarium fujikuroi]
MQPFSQSTFSSPVPSSQANRAIGDILQEIALDKWETLVSSSIRSARDAGLRLNCLTGNPWSEKRRERKSIKLADAYLPNTVPKNTEAFNSTPAHFQMRCWLQELCRMPPRRLLYKCKELCRGHIRLGADSACSNHQKYLDVSRRDYYIMWFVANVAVVAEIMLSSSPVFLRKTRLKPVLGVSLGRGDVVLPTMLQQFLQARLATIDAYNFTQLIVKFSTLFQYKRIFTTPEPAYTYAVTPTRFCSSGHLTLTFSVTSIVLIARSKTTVNSIFCQFSVGSVEANLLAASALANHATNTAANDPITHTITSGGDEFLIRGPPAAANGGSSISVKAQAKIVLATGLTFIITGTGNGVAGVAQVIVNESANNRPDQRVLQETLRLGKV